MNNTPSPTAAPRARDLTLAICAYNAEATLAETLQSVLAQTLLPEKILVIDDCSTDATPRVAHNILASQPYEVLSLPQNGGVGNGRRTAQLHATTRWLMFLDADDLLTPQAIEKMYAVISGDPDIMAVGCHVAFIDEKSRKIGGGIYLGDTTKEAFIERAAKGKLIFMQPTAITDREAALRVGGSDVASFPAGKPRYADYCEDCDLWTRMSDLYTEGRAIVVVPEVLALYRKAGTGLSAHTREMTLKMRYIKVNVKRRRQGLANLNFEEFLASMSPREMQRLERDVEAADALRLAWMRLRRGRVLSALWWLVHCVVARPGYLAAKVKANILR